MKDEKKLLLLDLEDQISERPNFIIMRYEKLGANAAHKFRRAVASQGGNVEVMRKTVLVKAAESAGISLSLEQLPGHIALVFAGKDFVTTAKQVFELRKGAEETIQILGGRLDNQVYRGDQVEKISNLPGIDVMRAQFLGVLEAPMSETLAVVEAILTSVIHCVNNRVEGAEKSKE